MLSNLQETERAGKLSDYFQPEIAFLESENIFGKRALNFLDPIPNETSLVSAYSCGSLFFLYCSTNYTFF